MINKERWYGFSLFQQMGHIGSEVCRARHLQEKGDLQNSKKSFARGIELVEGTIGAQYGKVRLRELTRLREILCDWHSGGQEHRIPLEQIEKYCTDFVLYKK